MIRERPDCPGLFHLYCHPHPGMDAALEIVFPFRQVRDLDGAALEDARLGHRDVAKAAFTFRNGCFSGSIEVRYEAAAKLGHLSESMRLATLIDDTDGCPLPDPERIGLEVPVRVRIGQGTPINIVDQGESIPETPAVRLLPDLNGPGLRNVRAAALRCILSSTVKVSDEKYFQCCIHPGCESDSTSGVARIGALTILDLW